MGAKSIPFFRYVELVGPFFFDSLGWRKREVLSHTSATRAPEVTRHLCPQLASARFRLNYDRHY